MAQTEWYQPYGVSRTRPGWYRNAEAGPSTLVAPPIPYIGQPATQPSGGISETTANAKTTKIVTEKHRVSVSNFYCSHISRVTKWLFSVRHSSGLGFRAVKGSHAPPVSTAERLAIACATGYGTGGATAQPPRSIRLWPVSKPPISNDAPDQFGYNAVAAEIIRRVRHPVHEKPRLKRGRSERTVIGTRSADSEAERRKVERRLYRRLSLYYSPPGGDDDAEWTRPPLLRKGKHGHGLTSNITLTQTLSNGRSQGSREFRAAQGPRRSQGSRGFQESPEA